MLNMEKRYVYITPEDYETAQKNGISITTLESRVRILQWDVDRAITESPKKYDNRGRWSKWKDICVVPYGTFCSRIRNGMNEEEAALTPFIPHKGRVESKLPFTEEQYETALKLGISRKRIAQRYATGKWSIEDCLTVKPMTKSEAAKVSVKVRRENSKLKSVWT